MKRAAGPSRCGSPSASSGSGSVEPQVWGVQIERVIGRRGEISHFAWVPRSEPGGIPSYGRLVGLADIEPGERLEVVPYVLARGEYVDPGPNPLPGPQGAPDGRGSRSPVPAHTGPRR
jgi:hypothetical protein